MKKLSAIIALAFSFSVNAQSDTGSFVLPDYLGGVTIPGQIIPYNYGQLTHPVYRYQIDTTLFKISKVPDEVLRITWDNRIYYLPSAFCNCRKCRKHKGLKELKLDK